MLLSLPCSVIHKTDRNRHPGDLAGQSFRERKRRAAVKRVHDGVEALSRPAAVTIAGEIRKV
jgi:hypothetical protein